MYSIKNEKDIPYILKYHRAKDMINIMKFFPNLSPIDDLVVILDEEDYLKNKDKVSDLTSIRNGNPISEPCMKSIPVKEINPDIINIIKEIKKENPKGVLILFHLNVQKTERYQRYAPLLNKFNQSIYQVDIDRLIYELRNISNKKFSLNMRISDVLN